MAGDFDWRIVRTHHCEMVLNLFAIRVKFGAVVSFAGPCKEKKIINLIIVKQKIKREEREKEKINK